VERALAPIDDATTAVEVHEALATVLHGLTHARAAVAVVLRSGAVHVAAVAGACDLEPGQAVTVDEVVRRMLDEHSGRSGSGTVAGAAATVWPVLAQRRTVAAVAVLEPRDQAHAELTVAACRYAGLRLSQLYDAELREDLLHERGAAIKTLRRLADTDALTGVANRSGVFAVLNSLLGRREPVGIVYLDLDHFKEINDRYGHSTGDAVLSAVAGRLRRVVRAPDVIGRIGGDEFVLVVRDADERALSHLVDRVSSVLGEPVTVKDATIPVHASCGIAVAAHGGNASDLLAAADSRMYRDKRSSGQRDADQVIDLDAHR
jgi:diguanylate cyclase (GGDEF)-like protein